MTMIVRDALEVFGRASLAVVWIHSSCPWGPRLIAELLSVKGRCQFVHVKSHSAPAEEERKLSVLDSKSTNVLYQEVFLGSVHVGNQTRWLTHDEISAGVIRAIESRVPHVVVGERGRPPESAQKYLQRNETLADRNARCLREIGNAEFSIDVRAAGVSSLVANCEPRSGGSKW